MGVCCYQGRYESAGTTGAANRNAAVVVRGFQSWTAQDRRWTELGPVGCGQQTVGRLRFPELQQVPQHWKARCCRRPWDCCWMLAAVGKETQCQWRWYPRLNCSPYYLHCREWARRWTCCVCCGHHASDPHERFVSCRSLQRFSLCMVRGMPMIFCWRSSRVEIQSHFAFDYIPVIDGRWTSLRHDQEARSVMCKSVVGSFKLTYEMFEAQDTPRQ